MWRRATLSLFVSITLAWDAVAGMPTPLPDLGEPDLSTGLTNVALSRIRAISFFLVILLGSAAVVRWLWNLLQQDFPRLPRMGYGRALGVVILWGLAFVIVLVMISGARELMTPGAWEKKGATYQLREGYEGESPTNPETQRREHLGSLRTALWQYAATHEGRFPDQAELSAITEELWKVPDSGGLRYLYQPGLKAGHAPEPLAYEPELSNDLRFVLRTDGEIVTMSSDELAESLGGSES